MTAFFSRRNQVYQKDNTVYKIFSDPGDLKTEAMLLEKLLAAGVSVPRILDKREDTLALTFVEGTPYAEIIDALGEKEVRELLDWQEAYYRALPGCSRPDINWRNYLWTGEICVGLDFEQIGNDAPERDYGRMLAFVATYAPACSDDRKDVVQWFLQGLIQRGYTPSAVFEHCQEELLRMEARRGYTREFAEEVQVWVESIF